MLQGADGADMGSIGPIGPIGPIEYTYTSYTMILSELVQEMKALQQKHDLVRLMTLLSTNKLI